MVMTSHTVKQDNARPSNGGYGMRQEYVLLGLRHSTGTLEQRLVIKLP